MKRCSSPIDRNKCSSLVPKLPSSPDAVPETALRSKACPEPSEDRVRQKPESTLRLSPAEWPPRRKTDTANNSRHIIAVYSFLVVFVQSLTCSSSVKPLHLHI